MTTSASSRALASDDPPRRGTSNARLEPWSLKREYRVVREHRFGIQDGGQGVVVDDDHLGCVNCLGPGGGDQCGDDVAHETHRSGGQRCAGEHRREGHGCRCSCDQRQLEILAPAAVKAGGGHKSLTTAPRRKAGPSSETGLDLLFRWWWGSAAGVLTKSGPAPGGVRSPAGRPGRARDERLLRRDARCSGVVGSVFPPLLIRVAGERP